MDTQGFKHVTETLKLYHRIKINDLNQGNEDQDEDIVEKLYVDLLPNNGILEQMLTNETTFLIGRRGTGKSTIIANAQHIIRKKQKNISVYINAKSVHTLSKTDNLSADLHSMSNVLTDKQLRKLLLLKNFLLAFKESLNEELKFEKNGFIDKLTNHFRDRKLQVALEKLNTIINTPELINISSAIHQEEKNGKSNEMLQSLGAALDSGLKSSLQVDVSNKETTSIEHQNSNILAQYFNIKPIIEVLKEIITICKRDRMFIFIDDFSELEEQDMISFVNTIISPLYHLSKDKINLKLACYPNRIYYGDIDPGKYKNLYIDMFDIYGKTNIVNLEKSSINYTERIINNRIAYFCKSSIEDYFDTRNTTMLEYYKLMYHGSMNIIRVLGHVLNYCWLSQLSHGKKINRAALEDALEQYYADTIKKYFDKSKYSKGVFNDKVDIFVQENLLENLLFEAQKNKTALKETENSYFRDLDIVPTSHFLIRSDLEETLNSLEFNGFLHKVNELASKGNVQDRKKNITNSLYALDYGLSLHEKIRYGKPAHKDSKFYQQRSFDYTHIIKNTLEKNKKIICNSCKKQFPMEDLELLQRFKMRCDNCENGICSIEFDRELSKTIQLNLRDALWSEDELDIINSIYLLNKNSSENEQIRATLIAKDVDQSHQFVARRCKELSESGFVKRNGKNPYNYTLTEKTLNQLKENSLI